MAADSLLKILDRIDSTNNYAMALIREGMAKHGMGIAAREQFGGKGQRGKSWQMQPGQSIAYSGIIDTAFLKSSQQFYLSMTIALAVIDFFKSYIKETIQIKWPNDLYWCDRKAGGILIETIYKGDNWQWAVAGIGINCNQKEFDSSLPNPASLLQITGAVYDIDILTATLHQCVMQRIQQLTDKKYRPAIIEEYNSLLYKRNEPVTLRKKNIVFTTIITGVAPSGELLTHDAMERQFSFGEVEWVLQ
jgi:BirA family transcriptional regulator, biotin operon repressor / biotin---[acetyl-CoA-carboxylase] ligase